MHIFRATTLAAVFLSAPAVTLAVPFEYIRIGDLDGFGFKEATGLKSSGRSFANKDQTGILGVGDRLPDLNEDGVLAARHGDDFDNRLRESIRCTWKSCSINLGSTGQDYTDISLSMTYDFSNGEHIKSTPGELKIYNHNAKAFGKGGKFPSSTPSSEGGNQPGFVFDFSVGKGDVDPNLPVYFTLVFADYDVIPAFVQHTKKLRGGDCPANSKGCQSGELKVKRQNSDGEVQLAFLELPFEEMFTENEDGTGWDGLFEVDFVADKEPYTAFDYVELSQRMPIPAPGSLFLVVLGLAGLAHRQAKLA
jgi:hypothetical protein